VLVKDEQSRIVNQWPHIKQFLRINSSGRVEGDHYFWWQVENTLTLAERAAANDEWADFYEWRLAQRVGELAGDRIQRHLVTKWTDSMAYCCRRLAAYARGDDPGDWVDQHERRPDLDEEGQTIVAEIVSTLDGYGTAGRASSKIAPASSAL
jgi:hypothetical protein